MSPPHSQATLPIIDSASVGSFLALGQVAGGRILPLLLLARRVAYKLNLQCCCGFKTALFRGGKKRKAEDVARLVGGVDADARDGLKKKKKNQAAKGERAGVAGVGQQGRKVYSIKITVLKDFNWPLRVYGMVVARDTVDRNRNILFFRSRSKYQELTQEDCSLCLTGPSRAIVAMDPVDFEVALTVEGVDKYSVSITLDHRVEDGATFSLSSDRCVAEFNIQQLDSVE